jgi:hypothetical protein
MRYGSSTVRFVPKQICHIRAEYSVSIHEILEADM